jgi:hypothetical protein
MWPPSVQSWPESGRLDHSLGCSKVSMLENDLWIQPERLHAANGPTASTKAAAAASRAAHLLPSNANKPAMIIATPAPTPSNRLQLLTAAPHCPLQS